MKIIMSAYLIDLKSATKPFNVHHWTSTSLLLVLIVCFVGSFYKNKSIFPQKKSPDKVRKCFSVIAE